MGELGKKELAEKVLAIAKARGALLFGDFTLTSGAKSSYYFDGRLVSLDPEGAYYVAKALLPILREYGAQALAGPTMGADPILGAVAAVSHQEGRPIPGLMVRKEPKEHGTKKFVEGPVKKGLRVAVVDDTCTTAKSLFHAIEAVEAVGCKVVKVLAILDRREGGSDALRKRGYDFQSLLEADDSGKIGPTAG